MHCFFICSDIALNNCIISKDTIKLSSTALHNTTEYYKFNHRLIRIRHLAPEVLDNFVYSTHSDIYACGITMWQVITKGIAVPFEAISNEEFFQSLQTKSIDHAPLLKHNDVPIIMQNILVSTQYKMMIIILGNNKKNAYYYF